MKKEEKWKSLESAFNDIEKQFGKGSIMVLGQKTHDYSIETISTGSIALDHALGIGGLPKGRVTEIYGPESSGKTTLGLHAIAEAQAADGLACFIDAEHAFDPIYAKAVGVNTDELIVSQPDNGEEALEITDSLVRSDMVDIVVIDSVAALTPRAEIEGEMGDSHMGLQARLMSQALRKLTANIAKTKTAVVFVNQMRMKIGVIFGNPETTTGGNALRFYSSIRLDIRRIATIKNASGATGNRTRVRVVKNKLSSPFREAEFDIVYGKGISQEGEIIDIGVEMGLIEKSGSWYSYGGEQIGQGRDKAKKFLEENVEIMSEIKNLIYKDDEA